MNNNCFLIFLVGYFKRPNPTTQQYLPYELSNFGEVLAIEYPQFIKLIKYVLKINPLVRKLKDHLFLLNSFGLLPFGRSFFKVNKLNYWLFRKYLTKTIAQYNFNKIITFTPEVYLLKDLFKNIPIYYYVVDDYLSYPCWKGNRQKKQFLYLESRLLSLAKAVIVSSVSLAEKYRKLHYNVIYFPNPANIKPFINLDKKNRSIPSDLKNIPHPIIGYAGDIETYRLNFNLVSRCVKFYTSYQFVFVGPVGIHDKIASKYIPRGKNIHYLGFKTHTQLSSYINQFDVCLIPFSLNHYGLMSFPLKTLEYLAMGKPIVTTALPAIKHLADKDLIYWSENDKKFIKNIKFALNDKKNDFPINQRINEARKNDWSIRIKDFLKIIEDKND